MKKYLLNIILLSALLLAIHKPVKAQYILNEADAQYELFNYTKAIDLYEQAYKKKATLYTAQRLGVCYALKHNYKQAESWYAIAVAMPESLPEDLLQYAKALQNNSKYSEAKAAYEKYASLNKGISVAQKNLWLNSCDSAIKWMNAPEAYTIKNVTELNSPQSDWAAAVYQGAIVYTSDRTDQASADLQGNDRPFLKFDGASIPDKEVYGWTGNRYLKLYLKEKNSDSSILFPLNAGTQYHVGAASFSSDGKEVYFTLTRIPKYPVYLKGKLATINVEIYSSKRDPVSNAWSAPVGFKYNNVNEWSVGDPYLAEDGKTLCFVSNMPGGKGDTDIYISHKTAEDGWSTPVNLKDINTAGNERSPSFDGDNNFYFSSDGYPGMGGLDIFKTANWNGTMDAPENLGYPINSPRDDFAFSFNTERSGYLSSDRSDGLGEDDIYNFQKQTIRAFWLTGIAYDKNSHTPLNNVIVSLGKKDGGILKMQTSADGAFKFNLDEASDYSLAGEKTSYRGDVVALTTSRPLYADLRQDLFLEAVVIDKAIRIENIYYDFDKSNIRPDAAIELDKLVKIMEDNPTIWIELGSHTDSRGNDQYNQWLSQSRANSAVQYIIDHGIDKNRITAKGYGESQLVNRCANGIVCSAAEHQANRRTEFKIVKQ